MLANPRNPLPCPVRAATPSGSASANGLPIQSMSQPTTILLLLSWFSPLSNPLRDSSARPQEQELQQLRTLPWRRSSLCQLSVAARGAPEDLLAGSARAHCRAFSVCHSSHRQHRSPRPGCWSPPPWSRPSSPQGASSSEWIPGARMCPSMHSIWSASGLLLGEDDWGPARSFVRLHPALTARSSRAVARVGCYAKAISHRPRLFGRALTAWAS
ncbi:uncharacterized protein LOC123430222 [Hordeum vulgare subsp. vulgare]|uniref:uncharacterized protein LOC123430222 n=1 Tax=Hordeum vulgare subsp. vulgare TaxID=112509 RepID=UPI001D1A4ECB|nr:uncharacterized protein LOC123430222 [Hordeum vulgare subsp. vulgare]